MWHDQIKEKRDGISLCIFEVESTCPDRFIGCNEAISEICRICCFPATFYRALELFKMTTEEMIRYRVNQIWPVFLWHMPVTEKEKDRARHHFIIPRLINYFNETNVY